MRRKFGNIQKDSLLESLSMDGFRDAWMIKKDDIKICQDCEFRHICTDCRAFIDNPNDKYSHPAKCEYNPYQAKWKGEAGYFPVRFMSEDQISKLKSMR